ncbi:type VI secretion system tube protein Hcp [Terrarubrum flagellatum]|uniref:Hcp family type VI secretion system effector n=1 Tax=Terrirubrum flagellatum TaxID=2895980 RepID=UPI003144FF4B
MAATDFFLKIDGIDGESEDDQLAKHLQLQSWSWGETNAGSSGLGGGAGSGKVAMQDFHFTVEMGSASTKLMQACATGKHIANAKLICRKSTGDKQDKYCEFTFTDIVISSYQVGGHGHGNPLPVEQISFNYTKIEMEYFKQDSKGILSSAGKLGWDLKKNVKV